ncbi:hypothetical protein APSETT445_004924 [Aspergillus pseudonomiae]
MASNTETEPLLDSASPTYDAVHDPNLEAPVHPTFQSKLPETSSHGKALNWSSAYILVISRVIGSGVFATPGSIVKSAGSIGLTLLLWLVGTVLAACGMAVSMEFGCFTASNSIIFAKYTLFAFNIEPTEYQHKALAVGLLTLITVVHGCFLKTGIWIQNILGWVKIGLIMAMSLTGIWVILLRPYEESLGESDRAVTNNPFAWDTLWEGSNWSWSLISTSIFKIFYSYAGLNNVNNVLNEVKDPIKTVKTVCPAGLLTAGGLYFLANISYFLVVPLDEIKNSGELVAGLLFERLFGAHVGRVLFPLAIAISAAGNVMVVTFALARVNQEIARQGFLPWSHLLSSSRPFNSPLGGLLVHYVPSVLVISLPPQGDVYNFILDVEGYPGQIFALAISVGLLIVRWREPSLHRPFKAWNWAVWLRIVVCLALLAAPFFPPPDRKGDVHFFYATYAIVGAGVPSIRQLL